MPEDEEVEAILRKVVTRVHERLEQRGLPSAFPSPRPEARSPEIGEWDQSATGGASSG